MTATASRCLSSGSTTRTFRWTGSRFTLPTAPSCCRASIRTPLWPLPVHAGGGRRAFGRKQLAACVLMLRDYPRINSKAAREYGELKTELARKFGGDRRSYISGKRELVEWLLWDGTTAS